jgi:OPA family sugar phosphate sensor protein UhpC-like MFS transporter
MRKPLLSFFRVSPPSQNKAGGDTDALYKKLRWQVFLAGTLGYSLYYVCRTTLNVVKKPMLDAGLCDTAQIGVVSSALLFAYAIGKFVNGFLADHVNLRRFMAAALALSAAANAVMGVMGLLSGFVSAAVLLSVFAVLWGVNGWAQSAGSPSAVVGLSRWFPLRQRGTYYGIFSLSHNLGEWLSFLFAGLLVASFGWVWGFWGAALAGALGVVLICALMHDTPESLGLPPVERLAGETAPPPGKTESTASLQLRVLKMPAVWILAGASAFMYMSRYAVNGWGVLFLQEAKGCDLVSASSIISINALLGILGTVLSGWFSDKFFNGDRYRPAFLFGACNTLALLLFLYGGNSWFINVSSMILFGISIGVLICFLGGLMAVDIVPRKAAGAAMGVVGIASYVAAGIQDIVSGRLIVKIHTPTGVSHDFSRAALFWVAASVVSFLLPLLNRKKAARPAAS